MVGGSLALQLATTNGYLQARAPGELRGRVLSLYVWLFVGVSPLGGLVAGWAAETVGASLVVLVAGACCIAVACLGWGVLSPPSGAQARKTT
jgi:hypothetical protein